MPSPSLSDRWIAAIKDNRYVAVAVVAATIIVDVTQVTEAGRRFIDLFRPDPIYRILADNLDYLEKEVGTLAIMSRYPPPPPNMINAEIDKLEDAAKPVCDTRDSFSKLGDTSTRHDLDGICIVVSKLKVLAEGTGGVGGAVLAAGLDNHGDVKKLREKVLARIGENVLARMGRHVAQWQEAETAK